VRIVWFATILVMMAGSAFAKPAAPETEVFVTNSVSVKKYHQGFCVSVNRGFGKIGYTLQDALDKGFVPCPKCHPPEAITHRYQKPDPNEERTVISKSANRFVTGDSAADIEKDSDGTAVGHGGSFVMTNGEDSLTNNSALSAREEIGEYRLLSLKVKQVGHSEELVKVAIYIKLANLSNSENFVNLTVAGLDRSGEVIAATIFDCTLAARETRVCSQGGTVSTAASEQIYRWVAR